MHTASNIVISNQSCIRVWGICPCRDRVKEWQEEVGVVVPVGALLDGGQALQAHARIDARRRQIGARAVGGSPSSLSAALSIEEVRGCAASPFDFCSCFCTTLKKKKSEFVTALGSKQMPYTY